MSAMHLSAKYEELCGMASKTLSPSAVCIAQMIPHTRCAAEETKATEQKSPVQQISCSDKEESGDLLIHGFWSCGSDIIMDICVTMLKLSCTGHDYPHKVLATQECEKKKKFLQACLEQHKYFIPFVVSTGGLIRQEGGELLKRLSLQLTDKSR
jgi:hypothetical protein